MPQPERFISREQQPRITPVAGGHMSYERLLVESQEHGLQFAKIHDASRFTDPVREHHSREYLVKEHAMLSHLRAQSFSHIPRHSRLIDDHSLIMEGLSPDDGWHWRAPTNQIDHYTHDVLAALDELAATEQPTDFLNSHGPAHDAFIREGWLSLDASGINTVATNLQHAASHMHPRMQNAAQQLRTQLQDLCTQPLPSGTPTQLCHHDLRQANVAWHPDYGARIVDWSWADVGLDHADHTSLLIDLHKSGHDMSRYLDRHFNPEHARLLLSFLLARSIAPARSDDSSVRFHQTVSAVSAFDLLQRQEQL